MPNPIDYLGMMGGPQALNINDTVRSAVLGAQQQQNNQNVLDAQRREDQTRQIVGQLVADPDKDEAEFEQLIRGLAEINPTEASRLRAWRAQQQATAEMLADPTGRNVGRYMMRYPEAAEGLSKGWAALDGAQRDATLKTSADVYGMLNAGDHAGAAQLLRDHMASSQKTGEDVSSYPHLIELIEQNPTAARAVAGMNMAAALGRDKFNEIYGTVGEERRADELQPSAVRKATADATTAEVGARFAPQKAQSELDTAISNRQRMAAQTANEVARLALDRDKLDLDRDTLTSNIEMKLEELDRNGTQLDAGGRTEVNRAVGESVAAQALADRMTRLADSMKGSGASSGWKAAFLERAKGAFGAQDAVSGLRAEYNQLVNAQAVKNLPPGPASDKDIQLAKQGFPPDSANAAYLSSFLRGMAKMQQAVAAGADRKANWISVNGSLAPARRDVDVAGVKVPAGTTFNEFNGNAVKRSRQGETPASLQSIVEKYGR